MRPALDDATKAMLADYASHSPITDPAANRPLFDALLAEVKDPSAELPRLCAIVRGLHLHYDDSPDYKIPESRHAEMYLRGIPAMLDKIRTLDSRPLSIPRPPEKRLVGCCRDFAVMLCALLRHKGVPSRVRYGWARYIKHPDLTYVDHVIVEYWQAGKKRWAYVDAQQDERLLRANGNPFPDATDIPRERFLTAGKLWQEWRAGRVKPDEFGYSAHLRGVWVAQGYLLHDALALAKREMNIADSWGMADVPPGHEPKGRERDILDRLAALAANGGPAEIGTLKRLIEETEGVRLPTRIKRYAHDGSFQMVDSERDTPAV
jgi:hypothetical protein